MPLYTYRCEAGHTFDRMGKMDGSDAPKVCHQDATHFTKDDLPIDGCSSAVKKVLATTARSFPGADSWRR